MYLIYFAVPLPDPTSKQENVGIGRAASAKNQKPLEGVSPKYFLGTEDGEVVYATHKLEKDNETGKSNGKLKKWVKIHSAITHI